MQTSRLVLGVEAGPRSSGARGVRALQGPHDKGKADATS